MNDVGGGPGWLDDWVYGRPLPPPETWARPGLALVFNLGCAGCVSRAVPWLKNVAGRASERAVLFAVHTAYAHRRLPRDEVAVAVERFAREVAHVPVPVALDLNGSWAASLGAAGTPHWFAWDQRGRLDRSVYGSQHNAFTRLGYLLEEWGLEHSA